MTCNEARELIGGDPDGTSPELLSHLATCPECQAYHEEMLALNAKIGQALKLDWPKATGAQPAALPSAVRSNVTPFRRKTRAAVAKHPRPRLFAFAASVAAAMLVALTLWLSRPTQTLAAEIVTHVKGEPSSWYQTRPVGADKLEAVLRKSGVRLGGGMQPVVYASSCWFRGHFVPHFVVMTQDGPVTVMILRNEKTPAAQTFNEDGYSGLLVPASAGSVAVLSRTPMSLEQPASDVVKALQSAN
ncbi:MAG: DUF3379 family protein [Steroidobacteraceae bacterium]